MEPRRHAHPSSAATVRLRCALLSLGLHAPIAVAALLTNSSDGTPPPRVQWSVEASLLAHASMHATATAIPDMPVERESDDPTAVPPLAELPIHDQQPAEPELRPSQTLLVDPAPASRMDPLQQARDATMPRKQKEAAAEATASAMTAADTTTTPSSASSEASPRVLTPIVGCNPRPEYPESARRRGIEGVVLVHIDADEEGMPIACEVLQSSGSVALDAAALRAARRWRFENGPGSVDVPFRFEITTIAANSR